MKLVLHNSVRACVHAEFPGEPRGAAPALQRVEGDADAPHCGNAVLSLVRSNPRNIARKRGGKPPPHKRVSAMHCSIEINRHGCFAELDLIHAGSWMSGSRSVFVPRSWHIQFLVATSNAFLNIPTTKPPFACKHLSLNRAR